MIICHLLIYFKIKKNKKFFPEGIPSEGQTLWISDQAGHFVAPDLGPNCLQRLLADDNVIGRIRVKLTWATFVNPACFLRYSSCIFTACAEGMFQCLDGNCVEGRMKCDGIPQCEDGSDEYECRTGKYDLRLY